MDRYTFRNKALGAVVGSAVGDALGAPFEFGRAGEYRKRFPDRVLGGIGEMVGGRGWKPGEFTDDTQMAIVQAESLLACGGVNGADLFERFRVWASVAADVGIQTRAVLGSGRSWDEAAAEHYQRHPSSAAGNGSVMRSAPAAVFFGRASVDASMEAARAMSAVTHGDPAAGWGAAILHAMVHAELNGEDAFERLAALLPMLPADQSRYREMLRPDWLPGDGGVSNGSVWGCLAQSVWAVRTTTSFEDAVVRAIDLGGDTDTVAAVTGGLAGAIHGIQSVPSRWSTYLNGTVGHADGLHTYLLRDLQRLGLALVGDEPAPEHGADRAVEAEIADGVHAANLAGAAAVPSDWAVVSLCRVGARFADHPIRRELYLADKADGHNGSLRDVVTDAVDTIDAFRAEGRQVVVHCHAGASRTGLVLRTWLMRGRGLTHHEATNFLAERWPLLDPTTNASFSAFLATDWPAGATRAARALDGHEPQTDSGNARDNDDAKTSEPAAAPFRCAENDPSPRRNPIDRPKAGRSTPTWNHAEVMSIICGLVHGPNVDGGAVMTHGHLVSGLLADAHGAKCARVALAIQQLDHPARRVETVAGNMVAWYSQKISDTYGNEADTGACPGCQREVHRTRGPKGWSYIR